MAATEATRSSSGSADSYIGSLISLTSKSEIRYEGVLFNINTEESSIGLRNVRSFGTEGRKKDGPQVPGSDKIYEYILFRGSDIKDLQVKSSPPVQTTTPLHNDPAIIQSHYPQSAIASTSLASSGIGSVPDPGSQNSQLGLPRSTFQGSLPLYQPGGSLAPWGSAPPPTTNGGGLAMPMYWQGYYGPSGGIQAQQQSLLRPPPGLSVPPSMQQPLHYTPVNASLPIGAQNLPASQLSENPPLLPPFSIGSQNLQFSFIPSQYSAVVSDSSTNLIADKAYSQTLSTAVSSTSLPYVSQLTSVLDKSTIALPIPDKPKTVPGPTMPFKGVSESTSFIAGTHTSILSDGTMPSLVTPGQLLQPGHQTVPLSQSSQTAQKDVEAVQVLSESLAPSAPAITHAPAPATAPVPAPAPAPAPAQQPHATEVQEPILPLPSPPDRKMNGAYAHHSYRGYRGGYERGRGSGSSHHATRFTEDFDFTAMNEKFNKDEVWGHLGKSNRAQEDGDDLEDEENVGSSKVEMPVYVKDDFFDSLSCDALDGGSRNGRPRFLEQLRRDTETFGDFSRHRGGRGGRGPFRGGRGPVRGGWSRGSYYGRGYGYVGRGRGYGTPR